MSSDSDTTNANDAQLRADIDRSLRHPVMFFFTSGAAWLALSIFLGVISSAKTTSPGFLDSCGWLTLGRVYPAHLSTLIYGWGCQAAFGLMIWLMARLSRKKCENAGMILVAGHLWNFAVLAGVLGILGGSSTGVPWMEFPVAVWPVLLLAYLTIVIGSLVHFRCREGGHVYISQWYLLGALFWFPWVLITSFLFIFVFDTHPVMAAGVDSWFKATMILLFFVPVGLASAYYLAPKVTGRPVYSYNLALFGFWTLAVVAPWAGMQKLAGAPIPQFLPAIGAAAMVLILIPALAVGVNILATVRGHGAVAAASPSLRFTIAGVIGFVVLGFLGLFMNAFGGLKLTQFSYAGYGYETLALYGFFSMCAFAGIYFIVPRITRREWLSRRFITWHFFLSVYGIVTVVASAILGGFMQGVAQEEWQSSWMDAATRGYSYGIGITAAWIFILLGNIFFVAHLLLMWARLGRRSQHPTLLVKPHHEESPHGPEGDLEEIEGANA